VLPRSSAKWGPPELVIPGAYIGSPVLSEDDLTLYYSDESDRCNITVCNQSDGPCSVDADCPGHHGIYVVQRASVGDPFGQPVAAAGLQNIPFLSPTWISPDSCRLYVIGAPAVVYAARHGE